MRNDNSEHLKFMREAIKLASKSVENGGGPFGAVIVKDHKIIARGNNIVTQKNDPTAHAEVTAIRNACRKLNTFNLEGCTVYTSCEPCPMCLASMYWARIDKFYYGNNQLDAAHIGFDDSFIYKEFEKASSRRYIKSEQILSQEAIASFRMWSDKEDKIAY